MSSARARLPSRRSRAASTDIPPDLAAPIALRSVADADTQVSVVRFVLFDERTLGVFRAAGIPFAISDDA